MTHFQITDRTNITETELRNSVSVDCKIEDTCVCSNLEKAIKEMRRVMIEDIYLSSTTKQETEELINKIKLFLNSELDINTIYID